MVGNSLYFGNSGILFNEQGWLEIIGLSAEIALGNFLEIALGQILSEKQEKVTFSQGSSNQIRLQNVETAKKNSVALLEKFHFLQLTQFSK